jgi:hypothetical protein
MQVVKRERRDQVVKGERRDQVNNARRREQAKLGRGVNSIKVQGVNREQKEGRE